MDFRFALRTLFKSPGFTAVLVLILGIGIAANTAMFTIVNDILLKPLPCPEGNRIMYAGTDNPSNGVAAAGVSYPDFLDWRAQSTSFSGLALVDQTTMTLSDGFTAAEPVPSARLTADAFRILRIAPVRGRDFRPGEDLPGAPPVVLLGYGLWMRRYGGDPAVIGSVIRVNNEPATVVGVMPEGMQFPALAGMWMPLVRTPERQRRDARGLIAFGRLRDGVSLAQARTEMELLGRRLEADYPATNRGVRPVVVPYTERVLDGKARLVLISLQGAVGFLLLVVCANAANLLLSRSLGRTREIAIRTALGAGRLVLVRQLLVESVMYAALGGVLGAVLGWCGVRAFDAATAATGRPYWLTFEMDFRVFAFLAGIVLLTGVLFGLAPALQLLRAGINDRLKEGGRGTGGSKAARRLASAFVTVQLAFTLVLLAGFGLLARSMVNIYAQAKGFDAAHVLTMRLRLPAGRYDTPEQRRSFQEILLASLRQIPGVQSAAIASHLPLGGSNVDDVLPEGQPLAADGKLPRGASLTVSPEYFRTFGIPLLRGRAFSPADGAPGHANTIVNRAFAAKYWPEGDALGKHVRVGAESYTVTGVAADVRQNPASAPELAAVVYLPARAVPAESFSVLLRTSAFPADLSAAARKRIQEMDPAVPVFSVRSMDEVVHLAHWPHRVFGSMFGVFALAAAVLAGLGIYSVVAYSVGMRTQEIGMRVALGATAAGIRRMVVLHGLRQAAVGLAVGFLGAFLLTRGLASLLVQVSATDPATFLAVGVFQTAIALLACWLPARRAARIDPIQALREQ